MKKLSQKGRSILLSIHIIFAGWWMGAAVSMILLNFLSGNIISGDELFATNAAIKHIDDFIIIPAALGSLLTGFLICLLTRWGFFRHRWVTVKWIVTITAILFGTFFLGPWVNGFVAISDTLRIDALADPIYVSSKNLNQIFGIAQTVIILFLVFVSVIKPWRKKKAENKQSQKLR